MREEAYAKSVLGLQRTDNNMEFTTWPQVNMINQKNYYTSVSHFHPSSDFVLSLGRQAIEEISITA